LDNNGNGHVSLAETGLFIKRTLSLHCQELAREAAGTRKLGKAANEEAVDKGVRLYKLYYPSYIRAFKDAADYGTDKKVSADESKTATYDDYVQYNEFRLLLNYLWLYAAMFDSFARVDGGSEGTTATDDRRVSADEWAAGALKLGGSPFLALSCVQKESVADIFTQMDSDGKGMVLLDEFCRFIEAGEVKAKTQIGKLLAAGEKK